MAVVAVAVTVAAAAAVVVVVGLVGLVAIASCQWREGLGWVDMCRFASRTHLHCGESVESGSRLGRVHGRTRLALVLRGTPCHHFEQRFHLFSTLRGRLARAR